VPGSIHPAARAHHGAVSSRPSVRPNPQILHVTVSDIFDRSHAGHMPYLWQGALSIVSQTLLVMGATMSPSLNSILCSLVPQREMIDQIINNVVMEIERYSVLSPSLSLSAEIIREAEARRRAFLSGLP